MVYSPLLLVFITAMKNNSKLSALLPKQCQKVVFVKIIDAEMIVWLSAKDRPDFLWRSVVAAAEKETAWCTEYIFILSYVLSWRYWGCWEVFWFWMQVLWKYCLHESDINGRLTAMVRNFILSQMTFFFFNFSFFFFFLYLKNQQLLLKPGHFACISNDFFFFFPVRTWYIPQEKQHFFFFLSSCSV